MAEGKAVRDIKGEDKKDKKDDKIQVVPGNIDVLSVQLLNSINQNLILILNELRKKPNKSEE